MFWVHDSSPEKYILNVVSFGKDRDSRENITNYFPREQTLSATLYSEKLKNQQNLNNN